MKNKNMKKEQEENDEKYKNNNKRKNYRWKTAISAGVVKTLLWLTKAMSALEVSCISNQIGYQESRNWSTGTNYYISGIVTGIQYTSPNNLVTKP